MANTGAWVRRHGYLVIALGLVTLFMATFVAAEGLHVPLLSDPRDLDDGGWPIGVVGFALLVSDVVLPVPSSGVMIAQGAAFGLALGSVLSLLGGTGATLAGYLLGQRSRHLVARLVSREGQARATDLLARHGAWAIVATRPIPMLAETTAILAGAARAMPWWKATLAGAAGNVVPAAAYAAVGAYAASFVNAIVVFIGVIVIAVGVWSAEQRAARTRLREARGAMKADA